jgi:integrase/recombinase XerD
MDQNVELIEEFKKDIQRRRLSKDTQKLYPFYIKDFYKSAGTFLEINDQHLNTYLDHLQTKNLKDTTVRKYFSGLVTFCDFLIMKKYINVNPVTPFRKYYLREYKNHDTTQRRKIITLAEATKFVQSILDPQTLAIVVLLLKTGIRLREACSLDVSSLDLENLTIKIPPTGKRSNEIVYFDLETKFVLSEWLRRREKLNKNGGQSLFLDKHGNRMEVHSLDRLFKKYAIAAGLHTGNDISHAFTPHNCRHFFTTILLDGENPMPREYVMELRGDSRQQAIDIYHHINPKKLKESYLKHIPDFGLR